MARNLLVINVALRETRVALIEDGVIAELQIERARARSTVGNIVLGKVTRVLPGMQAAFIDVGMERAAFLHVEDLIRPDDFEDYLAGAAHALERKTDLDNEKGEDGDEKPATTSPVAARQPPPLSASRPLELAHDDDPDSEDEDDEDEVSRASHPALDDEDDEDDELLAGADSDDDSEDDDESAPDSEDDEDADEDDDAEDDDSDDDDDDAEDDDDADEDDSEDDDAEDDDTDEDDDEDSEVDEPAPDSDDDDDDAEDDDDDDDDDAEDDDSEDTVAQSDAAQDDQAAGGDDADPEDSPAPRTRSRRPPRGNITPSDRPGADAAADGDEVRVRRRAAARPQDVSDDDTWTDPEAPTALASNPNAEPAQGADEDTGGEQDGRRRRRRRGRRRKNSGDAAERATQAAPEREAPREKASEPERGQRGQRRNERSGRRDRGRDKRKGGRGRDGDARRSPAGNRPADASRGQQAPARVSRSVPITEVVREGDEVIVQISKEPIGTKGARVTSHVSLPGRHVVYLPTVDHIGISKRIGSFKERQRLRKAIDTVKPPSGGLIVRTVAEGLTKKNLKEDIGYLLKLWAQVAKKRESARSPDVLYEELDLVLKVARDLFTDEIEKIVIDDKDEYARIVRFVEMFMPNRVKDVELYSGSDPIFDAYGIEDEISRALSRKVPLPSGGYLILDQAEALTAIDVNTGRYVGKGSKDLEETALKTNLEAVDEIAYQLRFRNIGGLVILDLIDMENPKNRDKVWRALEQRLEKDKAKTTLNRISELGLIEMTRKRTRESLGRTMHEPCFYCDGTGQIMSRTTIAYEILRQVRRELGMLPGYSVHVNAHPAIVDLLKTEEKDAVIEAERRYMRRIEFTPRREYHIEQFDLTGK